MPDKVDVDLQLGETGLDHNGRLRSTWSQQLAGKLRCSLPLAHPKPTDPTRCRLGRQPPQPQCTRQSEEARDHGLWIMNYQGSGCEEDGTSGQHEQEGNIEATRLNVRS